MELIINGRPRNFDRAGNVAQLLESLDLAGQRLACERNGEIVARSQFAATALCDGDRLEIITAVGGG